MLECVSKHIEAVASIIEQQCTGLIGSRDSRRFQKVPELCICQCAYVISQLAVSCTISVTNQVPYFCYSQLIS